MKAFIEISKNVKAKYKEKFPFIDVMCKSLQREDVKLAIGIYLRFKSQYFNQ